MKFLTTVFALLLSVAIAGCTSAPGGLGTVTGPEKTVDVTKLPSMRVVGVEIDVPRSLTVSEENSYKPAADIVWREDPPGDRYKQVQAIFEASVQRAIAGLQGDLPVVLHISVRQFHALTERTRYTIGGTHAIDFLMSVTNARTGDVIIPPYLVSTRLEGYGGDKALAAERIGLTQKVRITTHLAGLIRSELTGKPPAVAQEPALLAN